MSGTIVFQVAKYTFTILLIFFVAVEFQTFMKKNVVIKLIMLMALCYPLGKVIEFWLIGPEFVRGHLSDFGFVPCLAWFGVRDVRPFNRMEPWRAWLAAATTGLSIAGFVEYVEIGYQHLEIVKHALTRGDPLDMASYFVSFFLLLVLARKQVLIVRAFDAQQEQARAAQDLVAKDSRQASRRTAPPKQRRPGQRPGGRGRRSTHMGRRRNSHG